MALVPFFTKGKPLQTEVTADKLNTLASRSIVAVQGGFLAPMAGGGQMLIIGNQTLPDARATVLYGTDAVSLGAGNKFPLAVMVSDVDETTEADSLLFDTDALSVNNALFRKPGLYLVSYHACVEMDIGGDNDPTNPGAVAVTVYLRANTQSIPGSNSYAQAMKMPNLTGFVRTDGSALEQSIDPEGWTATSPTYGFVDVPQGVGAMNVAEWTSSAPALANPLEDGQVTTTIDASQGTDVTTNSTAIGTYTPAGSVTHTLSGTALVRVVLDPDNPGDLLIDIGGTTYANALNLYGVATGGETITLYCSLSALLLTS